MASPAPESATSAQLPTTKRACDLCRARKVRCDKETPCAACRTLKVACTTTQAPRAKRKRVHISADYENKFNELQAKLDGLVRSDGDQRQGNGATISELRHERAPSVSGVALSTPTMKETVEETAVFAGATSMRTHLSYARNLLQKAIAEVPLASTNPEMESAMASLKALTEQTSKVQASPAKSAPEPSASYQSPGQLTLPPVEAVLDLLRRCRDTATWTFSSPFTFLSIPALTNLCKDVYFAVDPYPVSSAVLVHGHLYYLFREFSLLATGEDKTKFMGYSNLCRDNLEAAMNSFPLIMQDSSDNVNALTLACGHATMTSRPTLAFKLTSAAVSMCLSLGWHRASTYTGMSADERKLTSLMFWSTYNMDKNLSIRVGRASLLQDYDIDAEMPDLGEGMRELYNAKMLTIWVATAKLQGQIYQRLYSPSALKSGPYAGNLFESLASLRTLHKDMEEYHEQIEAVPQSTAALQGAGRILLSSYVLLALTTEVMIHRALNNQSECLAASRAGIDFHLGIAKRYEKLVSHFWSMYLTFVFLQLPYVPFIVVFCNVLTASNLDDLHRLEAFTDTLKSGETEGLKKLHTLCSTFCQVARLYVEARQTSALPQDAGDFDNLFDNVNVNLLMMDNTLGGWFESQQLFTGLLDDTPYMQP